MEIKTKFDIGEDDLLEYITLKQTSNTDKQ